MLVHPFARPWSFPMLQTSSQSLKRVHVPRARRGGPLILINRMDFGFPVDMTVFCFIIYG